MSTNEHLYLEDIEVNQTFTSGTATLDEAQIKAFATEFDPQPFHLDNEEAKNTLFDGLAASGWHTAGTTMRLLVEGGAPFAGGLIGAGAELTWPMPTRPGDTLRVVTTVLAITPSRSRPDRGIVTVRSETLNQDDSVVQIMTSKLVVMRRQIAY